MCTYCLIYPKLIEKEIKINNDRRIIDSIRSDEKKYIFNRIWYDTVHPGQSSYWNNCSDIELMSCCLKREIVKDQIQWIIPDFKLDDMISNGNFLLKKFIKLRIFV